MLSLQGRSLSDLAESSGILAKNINARFSPPIIESGTLEMGTLVDRLQKRLCFSPFPESMTFAV